MEKQAGTDGKKKQISRRRDERREIKKE